MTALDAGDSLTPGTIVRDRDDDGASDAVVIRQRTDPADAVTVPIDGEPTVAELNPDYPSDADVVEVAFRDALDRTVENWQRYDGALLAGHVEGAPIRTYDYPVPRLRRAADGGTWA